MGVPKGTHTENIWADWHPQAVTTEAKRKLLAHILWLANVGHGQASWALLQVRDLTDVQVNSGVFSAAFHFSSEETSGRTWVSFVSSFNC